MSRHRSRPRAHSTSRSRFTARAENQLRGLNDLDDTITRLKAFEEAGADVLYAPGLRSHDEIRTVCDAVSKPVNVLAWPNLTVEGIFEAGAQRISFGSWLWDVSKRLGFDRAMEVAAEIRDTGDLSVLTSEVSVSVVEGSDTSRSAYDRRMTRVPDWGMIGRWAVLTSLIAALVLFFVVPDQRWIAAVFVGVALIDGLIFWVLMPRLQGGGSGGAPSLSDLEHMNAEAEWTTPDDEWGKRQPGDVLSGPRGGPSYGGGRVHPLPRRVHGQVGVACSMGRFVRRAMGCGAGLRTRHPALPLPRPYASRWRRSRAMRQRSRPVLDFRAVENAQFGDE